MSMNTLCNVLCASLVTGLIGCSEESETPAATQSSAPAETVAESTPSDSGAYPIDYCIVSGDKLGSMGDAIEVTVDGRTVMLCCNMCESKLRKDPADYLAILDAAAAGDAKVPETDDAHGSHEH